MKSIRSCTSIEWKYMFLAFSLFSIEVPSSAYGREWQRWLGCLTHQRCSLFIACRRATSVAWCSVVIAVDATRDLSAVLHLPYRQSLWGNWASHVYHLGLQRVTNKKMYKQDSLYEMLLISLYFKGTALCWGPTWISRNFVTDRCQRELWTKRSSLEGSNRSSSSKDSRFGRSRSHLPFLKRSLASIWCVKMRKIKPPMTTAIGRGRERLERKISVGLLLLRLCGETIWPTTGPRAFLTVSLRWPFAKLRAPM